MPEMQILESFDDKPFFSNKQIVNHQPDKFFIDFQKIIS